MPTTLTQKASKNTGPGCRALCRLKGINQTVKVTIKSLPERLLTSLEFTDSKTEDNDYCSGITLFLSVQGEGWVRSCFICVCASVFEIMSVNFLIHPGYVIMLSQAFGSTVSLSLKGSGCLFRIVFSFIFRHLDIIFSQLIEDLFLPSLYLLI